jgi:hypothetical protein
LPGEALLGLFFDAKLIAVAQRGFKPRHAAAEQYKRDYENTSGILSSIKGYQLLGNSQPEMTAVWAAKNSNHIIAYFYLIFKWKKGNITGYNASKDEGSTP